MLCDLFAEFEALKEKPPLDPHVPEILAQIGKRVATCPRFVLDRSATLMIQTISTQDVKNFIQTLDLCRMPFKRLWVEIAFADRSEWLVEQRRLGRELSQHDSSLEPHRLGFLLEEDNGDIVVHVVWNFVLPDLTTMEMARKALVITVGRPSDPVRKERHFREMMASPQERRRMNIKTEADGNWWAEMASRVDYVATPLYEPFWTLARRLGPAAVAEYEHKTMYDLAGEWRFVMALLIVLNSRNIIAIGEEEDTSRVNKARAKKGKTPILAHRPIRLNLSSVQKRRILALATGKGDASPHLVRGHFKVRKTGVYWWSPHARGGHADEQPRTYTVTA